MEDGHAGSIDEQRADFFFLTDVCSTETYTAIQAELMAKHERDFSGEFSERYFAELSDELRDLFDYCSSMCRNFKSDDNTHTEGSAFD